MPEFAGGTEKNCEGLYSVWDIDIDVKIIILCFPKKYDMKVWTGLMWPQCLPVATNFQVSF